PAALGHPGDHALVSEIPQADPAQAELAVDRAGPPAAVAARVLPHLEALRPVCLLDQRLPSQPVAPFVHSFLQTASRARAGGPGEPARADRRSSSAPRSRRRAPSPRSWPPPRPCSA